MAVRADNDLTGGDDALFRQQRVLNADLAHIIEVGDVEAAGEIAGGLAQLGGLDVLAGGVVIQHDGDLVLVEHAVKAGFVEHVNSDGGGHVVAQDEIQFGFDQVARFDGFQPSVGREDLLRHGHAHK